MNERQSAPFLLGDVAFEGENLFRSEFSGCLSIRDVDDPPLGDTFALGLAYKSTLVKGHLTDIDRENKSIVVSDEVALEYDLLLIASPTQGLTIITSIIASTVRSAFNSVYTFISFYCSHVLNSIPSRYNC